MSVRYKQMEYSGLVAYWRSPPAPGTAAGGAIKVSTGVGSALVLGVSVDLKVLWKLGGGTASAEATRVCRALAITHAQLQAFVAPLNLTQTATDAASAGPAIPFSTLLVEAAHDVAWQLQVVAAEGTQSDDWGPPAPPAGVRPARPRVHYVPEKKQLDTLTTALRAEPAGQHLMSLRIRARRRDQTGTRRTLFKLGFEFNNTGKLGIELSDVSEAGVEGTLDLAEAAFAPAPVATNPAVRVPDDVLTTPLTLLYQ